MRVLLSLPEACKKSNAYGFGDVGAPQAAAAGTAFETKTPLCEVHEYEVQR